MSLYAIACCTGTFKCLMPNQLKDKKGQNCNGMHYSCSLIWLKKPYYNTILSNNIFKNLLSCCIAENNKKLLDLNTQVQLISPRDVKTFFIFYFTAAAVAAVQFKSLKRAQRSQVSPLHLLLLR